MPSAPISIETPSTPWAVISYVDADLAWSEWLYFTLNAFPTPKPLAAHATRHGFAVPETITLFPDPADQGNASDRTTAIASARYLILICSRHSTHCESMDRDIRDFKKAGGEERILALVVDGNPGDAESRPPAVNPEWMAPWLRWRLDSSGVFQAADRSEPQVIDARNGRAGLDDLMGALLSALLDVPRADFDRVNGSVSGPNEDRKPQAPPVEASGDEACEAMEAAWILGRKNRRRTLRNACKATASLVGAAALLGIVGFWQTRVSAARQGTAALTARPSMPIPATISALPARPPVLREPAPLPELVTVRVPESAVTPSVRSPENSSTLAQTKPAEPARAVAPADPPTPRSNVGAPHYVAATLMTPMNRRIVIHR